MTTGATYASATIGSTSTTNTTSTVMDCNHPYYIHPSDSPGMQIIGIVLTENNYNQWHRSMEIALSSKLKLGFVDGTCVKPASTSPLLMYWNRCNNMITSWILNSVSEDRRNSIVYIQSARDIWLDLEVRFAQSNVPKLFHLRKEIAHLSQGTLSISAYFTKFRTLHDELECLLTKPKCVCNRCTCTVNSKLAEFDKNLQLTQFLMGLNDSFTGIRGQILLMTPLPSLNQSYSMLLQEEKQRENSGGGGFSSETMAMMVKAYPNNKAQGTNNISYGVKKGPESSVVCDYCHMTGHLRDKCYCIHGYPSWHKLFGKPKPKPKFLKERNSVVASVSTIDNGESMTSDSYRFL
ncbi:uncharacterized protein LOC141692072 [Apium graveolens]|uniref:uncharacterized protein LOC141692072 n=1 Tax=Apium graveolens TaxID=4045 RepID=UPI003D79E9E2